MNEEDVRQLLATALGKEGEKELRDQLDEAIDEKVPEEYRDTARALLDLLTGETR